MLKHHPNIPAYIPPLLCRHTSYPQPPPLITVVTSHSLWLHPPFLGAWNWSVWRQTTIMRSAPYHLSPCRLPGCSLCWGGMQTVADRLVRPSLYCPMELWNTRKLSIYEKMEIVFKLTSPPAPNPFVAFFSNALPLPKLGRYIQCS